MTLTFSQLSSSSQLLQALISVFYFIVVYFIIYLDIQCSVYARTISFFRNRFLKEKDFIHQSFYIITCFLFFQYSYSYFFTFEISTYQGENLVNPLQVVAQLSLYLFYYKYQRSDVRERHLILLCFICSVISTIFLKGINLGFECYIISILSIFIYIIDMDYVPLVVLLFYSIDVGLAKWAFFLLFQLVSYYVLEKFLDINQSIPPKRVIFTLVLEL